MGYDAGEFRDSRYGFCHVELSHSEVHVWNENESKRLLTLAPEEAVKLAQAILWSVEYYYGIEV